MSQSTDHDQAPAHLTKPSFLRTGHSHNGDWQICRRDSGGAPLNSFSICFLKHRRFSRPPLASRSYSHRGFTLLELVVVLVIFTAIFVLVPLNFGSFNYWRQESFVRKLSDTIQFLHHQSIADQVFYRIEFDLESGAYRVGVLRPDAGLQIDLPLYDQDAGDLTLQLAQFLNPSPGRSVEFVPPPHFPSLAEPVELPQGAVIESVRNMGGIRTYSQGGVATLTFSPRGFSEFGVIHLGLLGGGKTTILVNPFTGLAEVFRDYRDFEWSFGRRQEAS